MGLKRGITGKEPNLSMGEKIASIEARSRSPEKLEISGKESVLQMVICDFFSFEPQGSVIFEIFTEKIGHRTQFIPFLSIVNFGFWGTQRRSPFGNFFPCYKLLP